MPGITDAAPDPTELLDPTEPIEPNDDAGPTDTPEVNDDRVTEAMYAPGTVDHVQAAAATPQWRVATNYGPVLGKSGTVRKFRIAVEISLPITVAAFTSTVESTLGYSRSWIAGNNVRLQHVPGGTPYNFILYLATPQTAYKICASGGLDIRVGGVPYTSCRVGTRVVINSDRYFKGVSGYGASLAVYRQYVINHEVGHFLGHGHQYCPGLGRLAPVMQQQTLGLKGCKANSWPYVNGRRY